jgi:hypothetical protein
MLTLNDSPGRPPQRPVPGYDPATGLVWFDVGGTMYGVPEWAASDFSADGPTDDDRAEGVADA